MKNFDFRRFVPIIKVDEEERMVYGYASTPDLDSDGEIVKVEALEKALPEYMQFPAIREMHQPKAAGTTKQAEIRNGKKDKGLYIGAKIVDESAWEKVKEEVYKGFSIGGHITQKVGNSIQALELIEISLVDVPANKNAVIEVWKRGKFSKNAETVYMLSNLMIQLKDSVSYYIYLDKDATELKKALELVKKVIAREAQEKETDEDTQDIFFMRKAVVDCLERINFGNSNIIAEHIRKGVINDMSKKLINKNDNGEEKPEGDKEEKDEEKTEETPADGENKPEGNKPSEETPKKEEGKDSETPAEGEEKEDEEEAEEEENPETPEGEEKEDTKETSANPTFKKLQDIDSKLEKLSPANEPKKLGLSKAVNKIADTLAKMTGLLAKFEERLSALEDQPAATKSKSTLVVKNGGGNDPTDGEDGKEEKTELKTKKARLVELNSIFEKIGANEFAKRGLSLEAGKLQEEIKALMLSGKK